MDTDSQFSRRRLLEGAGAGFAAALLPKANHLGTISSEQGNSAGDEYDIHKQYGVTNVYAHHPDITPALTGVNDDGSTLFNVIKTHSVLWIDGDGIPRTIGSDQFPPADAFTKNMVSGIGFINNGTIFGNIQCHVSKNDAALPVHTKFQGFYYSSTDQGSESGHGKICECPGFSNTCFEGVIHDGKNNAIPMGQVWGTKEDPQNGHVADSDKPIFFLDESGKPELIKDAEGQPIKGSLNTDGTHWYAWNEEKVYMGSANGTTPRLDGVFEYSKNPKLNEQIKGLGGIAYIMSQTPGSPYALCVQFRNRSVGIISDSGIEFFKAPPIFEHQAVMFGLANENYLTGTITALTPGGKFGKMAEADDKTIGFVVPANNPSFEKATFFKNFKPFGMGPENKIYGLSSDGNEHYTYVVVDPSEGGKYPPNKPPEIASKGKEV